MTKTIETPAPLTALSVCAAVDRCTQQATRWTPKKSGELVETCFYHDKVARGLMMPGHTTVVLGIQRKGLSD